MEIRICVSLFNAVGQHLMEPNLIYVLMLWSIKYRSLLRQGLIMLTDTQTVFEVMCKKLEIILKNIDIDIASYFMSIAKTV